MNHSEGFLLEFHTDPPRGGGGGSGYETGGVWATQVQGDKNLEF